jgi:DNA-binding transcriptional MerR regulator
LSAAAIAAKSPDAFRTISEVAAELDVPQHVLRFWESRFTQIKPVKRAGGRRFYRPEDVDLLRGIRALLYSDGFTIRGVQKLLKEKGLRHVAGVGRGVMSEPVVVEKIVIVERPAAGPAKKRPVYLRSVPPPMSLPFFNAETGADAAPGLAKDERAKLKSLLGELQGLKKRLKAARI